jgi:hypothetical protein
MPDPGKSIWCAVARLQEPHKVATVKSRSWHEMSPAQQAGILCQDDMFAKFLVRNARPKRGVPKWSAVADTFALGSTYSILLCRRFGIDPEKVRK